MFVGERFRGEGARRGNGFPSFFLPSAREKNNKTKKKAGEGKRERLTRGFFLCFCFSGAFDDLGICHPFFLLSCTHFLFVRCVCDTEGETA